MLAADFSALIWVGMWAGLNAKRHHRAIVKALGSVMAIPWAAVFLQVFLERNMGSSGEAALAFAGWFGLGLIVDLVAGARAKRNLERHFRAAALQAR